MKKYLSFLFLINFLLACQSNNLKDYRSDLQSDDVDKICNASYYLGEAKDKESVPLLLAGIYDERIANHVKYKGMSVYYCRIVALNKITELNLSIQQYQLPDSTLINTFVDWALAEKLIEIEEINLKRM